MHPHGTRAHPYTPSHRTPHLESLEPRLLLSGDGLSAIYFNNADFTGANLTRIESTVNANWGTGSPDASIGSDTFSARFAGELMTVESGDYTFRVTASDGYRLWVDDKLVIDSWATHEPAASTTSSAVTLSAASRYHIVLEYYENTGSASVSLEWKRPGQSSFSVIPQAQLYSGQVDWPTDVGYVNVKDYGAVGDGITDDSVAIRNAVTAGRGKLLYFPNGTYLVGEGYTLGTDTATAKYTILQGQNRDNTILKLMDGDSDFQNTSSPKALFSFFDGTSTGQAFRNAVYDMTFNVGKDNPGAIGLKHTANNQGGIRNVNIRAEASSDGVRRGVNGLDFTQAWPGPSIIRDVLIEGFNTGINIGHYQYSLIFEYVTLQGQVTKGINNYQNVLMFRHLTSRNSVQVYSDAGGEGMLVLLDSSLTGGASANAAILEKGECLIRNTVVSGYGKVVDNTQSGMADVTDPAVVLGQYSNVAPVGAFTDRATTGLNLLIEETPDADYDAPSNWVRIENVTGDDTQAIRDAIAYANANGKTTLYFTKSTYNISGTIDITGGIRRIIGMECALDIGGTFETTASPVFRFTNLTSDQIIFERASSAYAASNAAYKWFENNTDKTVVLKSLKLEGANATNAYVSGAQGTGKVFIEDVVGRHWGFANGQQVWARQFNAESSVATNVINDGATLWIMGLKTEYGQTNTDTRNGGKTELLGGFFYPASHTVPADRPSNIITDAQASFTYRENGSNRYTVEVRETRGSQTLDYSSNPSGSMPLYIGYTNSTPAAPSGLGVTANGTSAINLAWTDNSSNETGFKIERKTGSGGTYSQIATVGAGATTYADSGLTAGTTYYYRVRAYNAGGDSTYSNEANATTQSASGGSIGAATAVASGTYNLTTEGQDDWAKWGRSALSDFDHKASGGAQISNWTAVGTGHSRTYNSAASHSWTDGTPTASATSNGYVRAGGAAGRGFELTAPAGTNERTLKLYVNTQYSAIGSLELSLDDGSATPQTLTITGGGGLDEKVITITYSAASNTTLRIRWTTTTSSGNVGLRAASLVAAPVTGSLSAADASASGTYNLTAEGEDDWAKWGRSALSDFDHKASGGAQISNWTAVGTGHSRTYNSAVSHSWTDGTPTASATSNGYVRTGGAADRGFELTAPADTTLRTLKLYVSTQYSATGRLELSLDDDSAADQTLTIAGGSGLEEHVVTITYSAASATSLRIRWVTNTSTGNVGLRAASLATAGAIRATGADLPGGETIDRGDQGRINRVAAEARKRLIHAGVAPADLAGVKIVLADLQGDTLAYTDGKTIVLDTDAAGHGWYVDRTPANDSEFAGQTPGGIDLLTVLMHELGHVAGLSHSSDAGAVMYGSLLEGVRKIDLL